MKPNPAPAFDYDLGRWCHRHRLSGSDVARILGLSPGHISRCRNGQRDLTRDQWAVLQRYAGESNSPRESPR